MFKVVNDFRDSKDNFRFYRVGDEYPAEGATKPTKTRIAELAKGKNKYNRVFIEEVADSTPPDNKTPDPQNGEGETDQ